ncbi:MAG: HD domain-containing protein [Gammaproteobacteria bacterium]
MAYDLKTIDKEVRQKAKLIFSNPKLINFYLKKRTSYLEKKLLVKFKEFNLHQNNLLVAVGGLGREEIFPCSDLDLSIIRIKTSKADETPIREFIAWMWDSGLNPGISVRTLRDAIKISKNDLSEYTNYLSQRLISDNHHQFKIFSEFKTKQRELLQPKYFLKHKYSEQFIRYKSYDSTAYKLEPNIKESPGGLRDFHMLVWLEDVFGKNILRNYLNSHLSKTELQDVYRSYNRLKLIRYLLHLESKQERLNFDNQIKIQKLIFPGKNTNSSVERLMRNYYLDAKNIQEANELLLGLSKNNSVIEVNSKNNLTSQERVLKTFISLGNKKQHKNFELNQFSQIKKLVGAIPSKKFQTKKIASLFMTFLKSPFHTSSLLRIMRQIGLLQKIIPEFRHIIGLMQFDLFHVYTVDEHIFKVVKNMRQMFISKSPEDLALEKELIRKVPKIEILYLAGLFHDISKGKHGDHSTLGGEAALSFSKKCSMNDLDADLICWLVKEHLTMSSWSQKMDVHDEQTIKDFAKKIGSVNKLDYLYLLTINDMRGTNPTLWNSWKHGLLSTLYLETRKVLNQDLGKPIKQTKEFLPLSILKFFGKEEREILEVNWNLLPYSYFTKYSQETILLDARLLREHASNDYKVQFEIMTDYLLLTIHGKDKFGLFNRIVEILGNLNLEVLDADIMTAFNKDFVLNKFVIKHKILGNNLHKDDLSKIHHTIAKNLSDFNLKLGSSKILMRSKSKIFSFQSKISIENDSNRRRKRITIETLDSPGLLIKISEIFLKENIQIHSARITTLGEKVEDTFLISSTKPNYFLEERSVEKLTASLQNL